MKLFFLFLTYLVGTVFTCNPSKSTADSVSAVLPPPAAPYSFKYKVNEPTKTQKLPAILKEISGLGRDSLGHLYAIQDEKGIIFQFKNNEIKQYKFKGDGDYEGIEVVGNKVYVMKNTGTIYEVHDLGTAQQKRMDYNDFLNSDYDVEGLGYEETTHSLLLACKADGNGDGNRAIYSFDLTSKKLNPKPYFNINMKAFQDKVFQYALEKEGEAFVKMIEKKGKDRLVFAPSAIAVHPITKDIYLLSAKGRMLMICNRKGEILHLEKLNKEFHEQPEGILFDPDGTMYISNEGKKRTGVIHTFEYDK